MAGKEKKRTHVSTLDWVKSQFVAPNTFDKPTANEDYLNDLERRKVAEAEQRRREEEAKRRQGQKARKDLGY